MRFKIEWDQGWQIAPAGSFRGGEVVTVDEYDALVKEQDALLPLAYVNGMESMPWRDQCNQLAEQAAQLIVERDALAAQLAKAEGEIEQVLTGKCNICSLGETELIRTETQVDGALWWHRTKGQPVMCFASAIRERQYQRHNRKE